MDGKYSVEVSEMLEFSFINKEFKKH